MASGYRKLGRPTDQRRAMLRNLVTSFLKHGKIETTVTRAKETRSLAEKMITLAKRGDLHARRQVLSFVTEELKKLGHSQWHATNDPTFVEANYCILREIFNIRNWGKPAMWCKSYVQCSLP